MLLVLAFGDKNNSPVPAGLAPLALYLLVLGLGNSWGIETGAYFLFVRGSLQS
jgi:aquaglyceroporin related protein